MGHSISGKQRSHKGFPVASILVAAMPAVTVSFRPATAVISVVVVPMAPFPSLPGPVTLQLCTASCVLEAVLCGHRQQGYCTGGHAAGN